MFNIIVAVGNHCIAWESFCFKMFKISSRYLLSKIFCHFIILVVGKVILFFHTLV